MANNSNRVSGSRAAIYVVDDEPMLLELAVVILEDLDYDIKTFRDPQEALQALRSLPSPPALVITDYAMHHMNGMDLIAQCRRVHPRQKTLLISGTVDEHVFDNSPVKPDRFLAKPYQAKQLLEAVTTVLRD